MVKCGGGGSCNDQKCANLHILNSRNDDFNGIVLLISSCVLSVYEIDVYNKMSFVLT